jgi:hypothetical protein
MVFAIYSAYKKNPSSVTSRKMGNTIGKLLIYISTIMVVYLVEKYILIDILPITKMVAGLISFVELKSIDETFNNLMGFSFYTGLINMIKRGASTTKDIVDEEK